MFELSQRLKLIASLVPYGARVCDVGTDHSYLSIYLKRTNTAKSVIATDIRRMPLLNAERNIAKSGVTGIDVRLCDGLSAVLKGEADTVIIAGMGGEVISGILDSCEWIKSSAITLILQPMTSAEELRKYLVNNGFEIKREPAIYENGKIYSVMVAKYTGVISRRNESYYYIGEVNPLTDDGLLYIKKQYKRCLECACSLESIESKNDEFMLFKQVADEIKTKLNTITESE